VVEAPDIDAPRRKALRDTGGLYDGPVYGTERCRFWRDTLEGKAVEVMDVIERVVGFRFFSSKYLDLGILCFILQPRRYGIYFKAFVVLMSIFPCFSRVLVDSEGWNAH